jgi:hypothetical protein
VLTSGDGRSQGPTVRIEKAEGRDGGTGAHIEIGTKPEARLSTLPSDRRDAPFTGRVEELGAIDHAFADRGRPEVVVLHGPPGVGKTRLAVEYALRHRVTPEAFATESVARRYPVGLGAPKAYRLDPEAEAYRRLVQAHFKAFAEAAYAYGEHPGDAGLRQRLLAYPAAKEYLERLSGHYLLGVFYARAGQFARALPWFERAVEAAQKGDVHGRVDQESLRISLEAVSICRAKLGRTP